MVHFLCCEVVQTLYFETTSLFETTEPPFCTRKSSNWKVAVRKFWCCVVKKTQTLEQVFWMLLFLFSCFLFLLFCLNLFSKQKRKEKQLIYSCRKNRFSVVLYFWPFRSYHPKNKTSFVVIIQKIKCLSRLSSRNWFSLSRLSSKKKLFIRGYHPEDNLEMYCMFIFIWGTRSKHVRITM